MEPPTRYYRLAAASLLLAGAALIVADVQHLLPIFRGDATFSEIATTPTWAVHSASHLVATFALILGLPALYLVQSPKLRSGGLIAFAAAILGAVAFAGAAFIMAFAAPTIATAAPQVLDGEAAGTIVIAFAAYPLAALGMLSFAAVTFRTNILPRWAAALTGVGAVLQLVGDGVGVPLGVLQGVGIVGLALALRRIASPVREAASAGAVA